MEFKVGDKVYVYKSISFKNFPILHAKNIGIIHKIDTFKELDWASEECGGKIIYVTLNSGKETSIYIGDGGGIIKNRKCILLSELLDKTQKFIDNALIV